MRYREEKYKSWLEDKAKCAADFRNFLLEKSILKIEDGAIWKSRYLEKANHNLDFAGLILDMHKNTIKEKFQNQTFFDWAVIAYYYAIYHAALALLANSGFKSKSHLVTLCGIINFYFHKEKSLERKHVEILSALEKINVEQFVEAQGLRERASYGVSTNFEERLAEIAKRDSIEFVNKVKEILAK